MDLAALIPTFGSFIFTILAFVVALSVIVAIHEYGHYIVGRWTGIKADVFSIGFGPVLYAKTDRHGTSWQIAALPFGGFVKFRGDSNAASAKDGDAMDGLSGEDLRSTMHGAPLWARTLTVLAGPVFNFTLSFLVFAGLLMVRGVASDPIMIEELRPMPGAVQELEAGDVILEVNGISVPSTEGFTSLRDSVEATELATFTVLRGGQEVLVDGPWVFPALVGAATPGSAAEEAGLQADDVITAVDGDPIFDFEQLREKVRGSNGNAIDLTVWRDGAYEAFTMTPRRTDLPLADGSFETHFIIGVSPGMSFVPASVTPSLGEAIAYGANQVVFITKTSLSGLYHMVVGKISTCNISGPIGIAETSGQAASQGWVSFVWFIAVLSTAVGMLNLFPIPVLDGGHLVFYFFEAITGRPPSDQALKYLMAGGLTVMLGLMLFAVTNDLFCP